MRVLWFNRFTVSFWFRSYQEFFLVLVLLIEKPNRLTILSKILIIMTDFVVTLPFYWDCFTLKKGHLQKFIYWTTIIPISHIKISNFSKLSFKQVEIPEKVFTINHILDKLNSSTKEKISHNSSFVMIQFFLLYVTWAG